MGTLASQPCSSCDLYSSLRSLCLRLASAQGKGSIDKLYVIECGQGHSTDNSRWSPGEDVGVPLDISDNCYPIHHTSGRYLLWDTGITDAVVGKTEGSTPSAPGAPVWHKAKTIVASLAELGVKPEDVTYVAASHTHPDHVGNVEFPKSMLLVQKAEYEWPLPLGVGRFKPEHPVTKLEGDHDVFGDGGAVILSTPGHTPGHQSLLVKLPKTGAVVLSGDAVHFKQNWEKRRISAGNTNKEQTLASMTRIADVLGKEHAQLWINR
jgi:N-acyl homoserine lactone hydrolase